MGNTNGKIKAKHITYSALGLLISKEHGGAYVAIANYSSSSISKPNFKFLSSKLKCTNWNKWHIISVTWSNERENLSNCCSNGEKLLSFTTGNVKGSDYCYIGDLDIMPDLKKKTLNRLYW